MQGCFKVLIHVALHFGGGCDRCDVMQRLDGAPGQSAYGGNSVGWWPASQAWVCSDFKKMDGIKKVAFLREVKVPSRAVAVITVVWKQALCNLFLKPSVNACVLVFKGLDWIAMATCMHDAAM